MSNFTKKWKQFLAEDRQGPHQIYCDMDGVLVDFLKGALNQMNEDTENASLPEKEDSGRLNALGKLKLVMKHTGVDRLEAHHIEKNARGPKELRKPAIKYMYERLWDDEEFWASLPWMPGGKSLWEAIRGYNPYILTAPMGKGSERGKQRWIDKNLNPQPQKVFMSHDKYKWAKNGDEKNVLIDDFISNIKPFRKSGGIAIHHTHEDLQQTLSRLTELGFRAQAIPSEHESAEARKEEEEKLSLLESPHGEEIHKASASIEQGTTPFQKKVKKKHRRLKKLTVGKGGNKKLSRGHKKADTKRSKSAPAGS